jgi:DNA-binding NarL/FixJ family response regulator
LTPISIVTADDHPIFRKGLRETLETDPGLQILAEAENGAQALTLIRKHSPAIAILDIHMPESGGLDVARAIHAEGLPTAVIVLTMYKDEEMFNAAIGAGVKGYVLKDSAITEIVGCIRAVATGQPYITPALSHLLLRRKNAVDESPASLSQLTPAEVRILKMISDYKTSKEIADELGIHPRTVDNHRTNISSKLQLQGSHSLLKYALRHRSMFHS